MSDNEVEVDGSDHDNVAENNVELGLDVRCGQQKRLTSAIWQRFTILDRKNHIAACNSCNKKLSFRTTVTNLKKHITRKHPCGGRTNRFPDPVVRNRISYQKENKPYEIQKTKLSDLGGLEGLVLNVIGEDGETETVIPNDEELHQEEVYTEEIYDYSGNDNQEERSTSKERRANKPQQTPTTDALERRKKNRIMDLQLECLEIKKYNMRLEALLLEQQLNIRRSSFTEALQNADTITRGTQTEVGGENTKIFYLADGKGGVPTRHFFTVQEVE